jgi:hypothetical protein
MNMLDVIVATGSLLSGESCSLVFAVRRRGRAELIDAEFQQSTFANELAHIAGISKTTYVLATPCCLNWRHDLQRTSTNNDQSENEAIRSDAPHRGRGDDRNRSGGRGAISGSA